MNILPYKLETTNDQLTSRAGLLTLAHLIDKLELPKRIDNLFPLPNSNRGINPSVYMLTLIMMQHEGSFHLDDVRHLEDDTALRMVLCMKKLPKPTSIGDWLRKTGAHQMTQNACQEINKVLLTSALHKCKHVLLDIDATEIIANKSSAEWTYKSNKGYMPMVGHIAQTGQVLACNFRKGNQSPNSNNLEFIWQCQEALPKGCQVKFSSVLWKACFLRYNHGCPILSTLVFILFVIKGISEAVIKLGISGVVLAIKLWVSNYAISPR